MRSTPRAIWFLVPAPLSANNPKNQLDALERLDTNA
jgi:hypothetical protein